MASTPKYITLAGSPSCPDEADPEAEPDEHQRGRDDDADGPSIRRVVPFDDPPHGPAM
jgi:hypothetical protein